MHDFDHALIDHMRGEAGGRATERASHLRAELSLDYDTTLSLVYVSENDGGAGFGGRR